MSSFYKKKIAQWSWYDLKMVISTNDTIKELPKEKLPAVISAEEQTGGRGRNGRKWQGIEGNLYFTYSLSVPWNELSRYVCIIGLSLAKTIKAISPSADVKIKWPNDIFLSQKKVTGILIENMTEDTWAVGIGVNIVASPQIKDMPYRATSLKENGINIERTQFLEQYLQVLTKTIDEYKNNGFVSIKQQWLDLALNLGKIIRVKNGDNIKTGQFLTLDENGYLILKIEDKEERIIAGDVFI